MMKSDRLRFENRAAFRAWLTEHHQASPGLWLVLGKSGGVKTLSAHEALEEALCFGWIDGQLQSIDAQQYIKRFTPRREGSEWSERNRKLAEKLAAKGVMTAAGLAAMDRAKQGGTWDQPRREPITDEQVAVLTAALAGTGMALANFLNMSPSVRRTYTAAYLDAKKEETRKKRLATIVERLRENKKPM